FGRTISLRPHTSSSDGPLQTPSISARRSFSRHSSTWNHSRTARKGRGDNPEDSVEEILCGADDLLLLLFVGGFSIHRRAVAHLDHRRQVFGLEELRRNVSFGTSRSKRVQREKGNRLPHYHNVPFPSCGKQKLHFAYERARSVSLFLRTSRCGSDGLCGRKRVGCIRGHVRIVPFGNLCGYKEVLGKACDSRTARFLSVLPTLRFLPWRLFCTYGRSGCRRTA